MKHFIYVSVLLSFILLLFGSYSFAYGPDLTDSNWESFNYNGTELDFIQAISNQLWGNNLEDLGAAGQNLNKLNNFFTRQPDYNTFYIYQYLSNNTDYMQVFMCDNWGSGYRYDFHISSGTLRVSETSLSNVGIVSPVFSNTYDKAKYVITASNIYYKSVFNIVSTPQSDLKYFSHKNSLMSININGSYTSFYKADYYLNGWINIGYLESYQNYNELQGYFAVYAGKSNVDNSNYYDSIANFIYYKNEDLNYYNNLKLDYSTGEIYINSQILQYNHGYSLYFTGDGNVSTPAALYYFVPYGSSEVSGDINNDNPTSLDFNFINSVEYLSTVNSGELALNFKNNLFPSGDLSKIADASGFNKYHNKYFNLLYNFYQHIITTLTGSGNVTLPISYRNFHWTLNSNEFTIPDNPIKSLVRIILIVWCVYLVYQDLDKQYRHIREFNLFAFLHDTDVDYHMFL